MIYDFTADDVFEIAEQLERTGCPKKSIRILFHNTNVYQC